MNHAVRVVKGIAAVVLLVVLIVGVPWALWHFIGWPLPHSVPSWAEVRRTLEQNGIPDEVLLKALAVVVWLTWALLVISIVTEAAAAIRGTTVTHLPLAGPFQALAGVLVSAVIVAAMTTLTRAPPTQSPSLVASLHRSDPAVSPARFVNVTIPTARASPDGKAVNDTPPATTAEIPVVYEVVPGDTLWDIAQGHLGDPFRWPEIYELNKGKPQPDGRALTDPHWIYPGWQFELPSMGAAVPAPPVVAPPQPPAPLAPAAPVPSTVAPTTTTPPSTSVTAPSSIAPPADHKNPTSASPSGTEHHRQDDDRVVLGVAGAVTAAGIVTALSVLRRRQLKRRRPGQAVRRPSPEFVSTEIAARALAADAPGPWLDVALRALAARTRVGGTHDAPRPVALQVGENELVVMLEEPNLDAPRPWKTRAPGWLWELPRAVSTVHLRSVAANACAPMPAVATIGRGPEGPVMIDLEACGLVCIEGSTMEARALARSIALELAVSPIADNLEVLLVDRGVLLQTSDATPRLRVVESVDSALDVAAKQVGAMDHALDERGHATTFEARVAGRGGDPWAPLLLIFGEAPTDPGLRDRLKEIAEPTGHGIGVLVVGTLPEAPWKLHVHDGVVDVPRLGVAGLEAELDMQGLEPDTAGAVMQLLDETLEDIDEPLVPVVEERAECGSACSKAAVGEPERQVEIEVRVLGDVEVVGATRRLTERETELVAFLAMREHPVDPDTVQTALWPERMVSTKRWWNIVTDVRNALGVGKDGEFHLPVVERGERLSLRPTVGTDIARVQTELRRSSIATHDDAIAGLTDSLKVVRGRPFTAAHGYAWANAYGFVAHAEAVVVDAAHLLAGLLLDGGDPGAALDVAAAGLRGAPANEILYRDRMLAHHRLGNISGIEGDLRDLCAALDVEDPYDDLHPDTVDLYEKLARRPPSTARGRATGS